MKVLKRFFITLVLVLSILVCGLFYLGYESYKAETASLSVPQLKETLKEKIENYTEIDEIAKPFKDAIVAVEDHRFYTRKGIDFIALSRAVVRNVLAQDLIEGGSTITQQLAKNVYYDYRTNLIRKIAEFYFLYDLENNYTKDEILEMYLNVIYFGDGYYGIYDASRGYFHKDPIDLNLFESSLLAGLTNAPSIYQLSTGLDKAFIRQRHVLKRMLETDFISEETYRAVLLEQSEYQKSS